MAKGDNNIIFKRVSGAIGRQIVAKQYASGIVLSNYPDMSGIKPSKKQKTERSKFRDAVAYAQSVISNPKKKAAYSKTLPKGTSVYHAAIKEYVARK